MDVSMATLRVQTSADALCSQLIGWRFPPVLQAVADARWAVEQFASRVYCPRCGDTTGPGEATLQGCAQCAEGAELDGGIGDGFVRLGVYADPLRGWVRAIKYGGWSEMATYLGGLIGGQIAESRMIEAGNTMIVPMPMPWLRRFYRGIDHANLIAQGVSKLLDAPLVKVLSRGSVPPQVSLTPSERRRAGSRKMNVRRRIGGWYLRDADLVLVDDVRTTGASLLAAVRMLRKLRPRRIMCAVVAVSDATARRQRMQSIGHTVP